ncbi:hypothetical protein [Vibrio navarrensis]|uniref:Uncharacterized protein n=1 Tax=Vibrio navarrensis TaxID=29495 RepID=A0AAJ4LWV1_9VIBR|nr:hypothetical protein [Vibrio navarrensis]MBE3653836.1 hypothetical protein [Vibrio navarrensis]QPL56542.1 hypothetical protein I3X05_23905 [Vibrio navarrensis]
MDASECDLSALKIEAAKMQGHEALVNCLRDLQLSYESSLQQAILFTATNNGTVEVLESGVTRLTLSDFQVDCFRPYSDIDRFYFEY